MSFTNIGFDKKKALDVISEIESTRIDYNSLRELNTQIIEYKKMQSDIEKIKDELKELKAQMPDICPTCGQPMKECTE